MPPPARVVLVGEAMGEAGVGYVENLKIDLTLAREDVTCSSDELEPKPLRTDGTWYRRRGGTADLRDHRWCSCCSSSP